ncbi:MAG: hypothetical protein M3Y84_14090 [Acidobacteriota bacterium]|nr:hypothetical protein [Acidobacteriota bacterium]
MVVAPHPRKATARRTSHLSVGKDQLTVDKHVTDADWKMMRLFEGGLIANCVFIDVTESAAKPSRIMPRSRKAKIWVGNKVIFRIASSNENTFSSRAYRPRSRALLP